MISNEKGSSLIWFINLMALLVVIILLMSAAIGEFQNARSLKLFADEYALSILSLTQQGNSLSESRQKLEEVLQVEKAVNLEIKFLEDGKTLEVIACKRWQSPIPIIQASRVFCERSRAR